MGHLKRAAAPAFWPIARKRFKWVTRPKPGPHPIERCLPLILIVREILGYARNRREAKYIISRGMILVDGKPRKELGFPVGLMDVVSIPASGEHFRVLPSKRGGLVLHPIDEDEAKFKLCRINGKTTVKGGHIQLNLHDGRNVLIRVSDPTNPQEDVYKTWDVLKISLPKQEILDHYKFEKGAVSIIIDGKNSGRVGWIEDVKVVPMSKHLVTLRDKEGTLFQTIKDYVFVVGREEPVISLPES